MWYVYILRCSDETLYTGVTTDVERRVREHTSIKKGSSYARGRLPVKVVYQETHPDRPSALKREIQIKSWPKQEKEAFILQRDTHDPTRNTMKDIITERFDEWTGGLAPEKGRIRIFERIRDIPFAIVPEFFSLEKGPAGMLAENRGFCVSKHFLLGMMCRKTGIPVRYCTCSFRWSELEVDYPADLRKLTQALPVTYHLTCRAFIGGRWVLVDATWDPGLKKAGFPVNEKWDGKSDTGNAVNPLEEFISEDAVEGEKIFKEKTASYDLQEKLRLSRFSGKFNRWLEKVR